MKITTIKKSMMVTALIVSMSGITVAQADDRGRGNDNHGNQANDNRGKPDWNDRGNDNRGNSKWQGNNRGNDYRNDNKRGNNGWHGQRFHAPAPYARPHGYQARAWRNGDRLPSTYRASRYYVDYRQYQLSAPPRGYQWVRVNNDVILTAIATGVIASVITGLYY